MRIITQLKKMEMNLNVMLWGQWFRDQLLVSLWWDWCFFRSIPRIDWSNMKNILVVYFPNNEISAKFDWWVDRSWKGDSFCEISVQYLVITDQHVGSILVDFLERKKIYGVKRDTICSTDWLLPFLCILFKYLKKNDRFLVHCWVKFASLKKY